jgi:hypothetical protein
VSNPNNERAAIESAQSTAAALPLLVGALQRLRAQVDQQDVDEMHRESQRKMAETLRTLYQVATLGGYRLVAVAGGQGAGKTTLMENLYPGAAAWLTGNPGRGETNPLIIVETAGLSAPRGVAVRRITGTTDLDEQTYGESDLPAWTDLVRGTDAEVLLLRLEVPPSYWNLAKAGFVLLPGYDRVLAEWQSLMRMVLATSPAAIVVTDAGRLADGGQQAIVADIRRAGGVSEKPADVVVVLGRCEDLTAAETAELVSNAAVTYGVAESAVVPAGRRPTAPPGWPDALRAAVERILPTAAHARRYEVALLRECLRTEVRAATGLANSLRDRMKVQDADEVLYRKILTAFDDERDQLMTALMAEAKTQFDGYYAAAEKKLNESLVKTGGWPEHLERIDDFISQDPEGADRRRTGLVEAAWNEPAAHALQAQVLRTAVATRLSVHDADRLTVSDFEPLVTMDARNEARFLKAVKVLPAMALNARAFAVGLANRAGTIELTADQLASRMAAQDRTSNLLFRTLGLFTRVDVGEQADPLSYIAAATAAAGLFGLGATGAATAGAAGAAGAAAMGAGGTAVVGAAGVGAVVALTPVLVGSVVAVVGVGLLQAGNRAVKERAAMARMHLTAHRVAAMDHVQRSVASIMDTTRDLLANRLRDALGLDDAVTREFALVRAIKDTERVQRRLLELLDDGHVA